MAEKKRSKYDTDPLDPDFVRRTEEVSGGATRDVARTPAEQARRDPAAEEPTRRLYHLKEPEEEHVSASYPSVFVPPIYQPPQQQTRTAVTPTPPPAAAHAFNQAAVAKPSRRQIAKLGLPENIALVLPYAPFHIGLVAAIVEMLLVPREETRVRFHSAQGLALQLVILAGAIIFGFIEAITGNDLGGNLFTLASTIFLVISMLRVWQGKPHHIPPLDELTKKVNEKFEPRK